MLTNVRNAAVVHCSALTVSTRLKSRLSSANFYTISDSVSTGLWSLSQTVTVPATTWAFNPMRLKKSWNFCAMISKPSPVSVSILLSTKKAMKFFSSPLPVTYSPTPVFIRSWDTSCSSMKLGLTTPCQRTLPRAVTSVLSCLSTWRRNSTQKCIMKRNASAQNGS